MTFGLTLYPEPQSSRLRFMKPNLLHIVFLNTVQVQTSIMSQACKECHAAKVKCDKTFPCSRCERLRRTCVPHESKQGQKRKRAVKDGLKETEDAHVSAQVVSLRSDHWGLQYLVRSWVSIALRRRSFSLLSRASSVAVRSGISMDQVLCENEKHRGMDFLYPMLLSPVDKQQVLGKDLDFDEVPVALRTAIACSSLHTAKNRWLWIREMRKGVSRYYCSPAFQENLASKEDVMKTYQKNKKSVAELFLTNTPKHIRAFAHQITLHENAGTAPKPSRVTNLEIRKKCGKNVIVDQVACLAILDLDHAFWSLEYVVQENEKPSIKSGGGRSGSTDSLSPQVERLDLDNMLDLDGLVNDDELEFMFDLLA